MGEEVRKSRLMVLCIIVLNILGTGCTKSVTADPESSSAREPSREDNIDANEDLIMSDSHAALGINAGAAICGNNVLEPGETCDGASLGICLLCSASCSCAPAQLAGIPGGGGPRTRVIDECVLPRTTQCEQEGCTIFTVPSPSGININVTEWGNDQGPPMLLIHGFPWSYVSWLPQLTDPELAANFHLFTMDFRGFGLSDKPTGALDYEASALWAADVKAVIDAVSGGAPIVVVGHSYGSLAISDYLSVEGDAALAGIVFVGGFIPSREGLVVDTFLDECVAPLLPGLFVNDIEKSSDSLQGFLTISSNLPVDQYVKDLHFASGNMSTSFSRERTLSRDFLNLPSNVISYNDVLNTITKPVLLVHGIDDRVVEARASDHYEAELTNSVCVRKVIFGNNVGHTPHLEQVDKFNSLLLDFSQQLAAFCN